MTKELKLKNGTIILVMENDFENIENWDSANIACENLGAGWRLPNFNELLEIFKNKDSFNFADYGYWSYWSNEVVLDQAYILNGPDGLKSLSNKSEEAYFRAVKTKD
jgi:hypothetical protein